MNHVKFFIVFLICLCIVGCGDRPKVLKEYYENGNLKTEQTVLKGKREGITRAYYENGNVQEEGMFKDDLPHGEFNYYSEDGELQDWEEYEYGKLVSSTKSESQQDANRLFNLGWENLQADNHQEALQYFEQVVELEPNYGAAYVNIALMHYNLGNYSDSVINLDKAKDLGADVNPEFEEALKPFRGGIANIGELEQKVENLFQTALRNLQSNNFQEAVDYFGQVIDINPNDAGAYANMALANFNLQNYSESIANLDEAKSLGFTQAAELEKMVQPYREREFRLGKSSVNGTSLCSEQLMFDVLLTGIGEPTSIQTKFIHWEDEGKSWLEVWELEGNVSMNRISISFFPQDDGSTTFAIVENKQ